MFRLHVARYHWFLHQTGDNSILGGADAWTQSLISLYATCKQVLPHHWLLCPENFYSSFKIWLSLLLGYYDGLFLSFRLESICIVPHSIKQFAPNVQLTQEDGGSALRSCWLAPTVCSPHSPCLTCYAQLKKQRAKGCGPVIYTWTCSHKGTVTTKHLHILRLSWLSSPCWRNTLVCARWNVKSLLP